MVEKHRHLLFYALRYEGMEQSPNIVYGGAVPNQLVMPAVHWALENLGKAGDSRQGAKRVYLAGSDYAFSRVLNLLIKDLLAAHGAEVVGEFYAPLKSTLMDELAGDIALQQPDMVLNSISGIDNGAFFDALRAQGITADKVPVLSFGVTEVLVAVDTARMAGHYAARNYFQTVPSAENRDFVEKFRERFGSHAGLDSPAEASYVNMRMWVEAAREAGSGNLAGVQRTILRQSLPAPEGIVSLDPDHTSFLESGARWKGAGRWAVRYRLGIGTAARALAISVLPLAGRVGSSAQVARVDRGAEIMMRFTSLTQRFAVWFVAVSLLPILIIGYTLMRTFETEMEQTAIRQVSAIADMKAEQIDSYLRERLLDARVIQTASTTRQAMREFAEVHARWGVNSDAYRRLDARYREHFKRFVEEADYYDLFLISPQGQIVYTDAHEADFDTNLITGPYRNTAAWAWLPVRL